MQFGTLKFIFMEQVGASLLSRFIYKKPSPCLLLLCFVLFLPIQARAHAPWSAHNFAYGRSDVRTKGQEPQSRTNATRT